MKPATHKKLTWSELALIDRTGLTKPKGETDLKQKAAIRLEQRRQFEACVYQCEALNDVFVHVCRREMLTEGDVDEGDLTEGDADKPPTVICLDTREVAAEAGNVHGESGRASATTRNPAHLNSVVQWCWQC